MTDSGKETRIVPVAGKSIVVRKLKDAQLLLMSRDAATLQKEGIDNQEKLEAAGYIMDTFESVIVQDADKAHVRKAIRAGDIELADLLVFMSVFAEDEAQLKPVVRRGRTPRGAKS